MTMLHVVGAKIWGGGEQYVYDMCDELQRRQISSFVLIDRSNIEFCERFNLVSNVVTANLYSVKGFSSIISIVDCIKKNNITTIHCHSGKYILLCLALKKLTHVKLIFYKHNVIAAKTDVYHNWIQSNVDAFICVSKLVYEAQCIDKYRDKFHLVYNGVNTNRFLKKSRKVADNKYFTIGYAGRIIDNKGIFELIEAVRFLHNEGYPVYLTICGVIANQAVQTKLERYIESYQTYMQYIGFQEDMNSFYRSLDCLVAPSKVSEAFGLVLCEAMYCQIPVIASRSGAQGEIIEHDQSGILLNTITAEQIAFAIKTLLDNHEYYHKLSQNGYNRVKSKFTTEVMVDSILRVLESL
ncbi:glycosyltransferase family 4 protein [Veillonella caviae]|uniref:glycosyltransferase family 4 protein n=1 Tax=Veillonella caviae TaxID=248316 RepID=UPI00235596B1|nr:glycosyltransferase family 4 protein [Veillonella caviae]